MSVDELAAATAQQTGDLPPSMPLLAVANGDADEHDYFDEDDDDECVFDAKAAAAAAASAAASSTLGGRCAILGGPHSPAGSSACSAASSVIFSGACASSAASASCRFPSTSGVLNACVDSRPPTARHSSSSGAGAALCSQQPMSSPSLAASQRQACYASYHPASALGPLPSLAASAASGCSSRRSLRDQNSVTIKATTVVKDAAGAIDKILSRGVTALVTALRAGSPPYNTTYDSLNQAVKAIAVARQYAKETGPAGAEVTFLPFQRLDASERPDPSRLGFLVFPVSRLRDVLKTADETVLNVARGSDVHKMAGAIIAVMLDRGQAVMKAAGSDAIFVAMSAVVAARHRLVSKHGFDLMLAAAWITEDTVATMGRESKFLRFNILKTEPAGPRSAVPPALPAGLEA
ncbi:hypothetical protein GPECTOR_6g869 [Gonium pectorale]|uniref:Uncharacterized protein n=1 Tax=Gonium pectorale TaxID=33097 RepID=A0A150GVT3_GONPE|nr:hypothetical protein GPECTOR_6g869 [Gonium pectorale]|eukprot:KXZ53951.1 hypothetical protein GPECTOR_6g869 [Gonium pectorale]